MDGNAEAEAERATACAAALDEEGARRRECDRRLEVCGIRPT